jgi:uncharacterized protein (TIGR02453 family)
MLAAVSTTGAHFTPELFKFLRDLKRNNRREWFEKHKPRYIEHVRDPMLRFIEDFAPHLAKLNPDLVADPRPNGGSLFRIHRDVRFSSDKRPYKTHVAARFSHRKGKDVHVPGFYLSLGPGEVYLAGGLWRPDTATAHRVRTAIVAQAPRWTRIVSAKPFRATWSFEGESLSRPARGFDPNHPLVDDLKRKDFIIVAELTEKDACSPGFLKRYVTACRSAGEFVQFLTEAAGL